MTTLAFGKIQGKLMACEKYSVIDAAILAEAVIDSFSEHIRDAVLRWAEGEDVMSLTSNGTTVAYIIEAVGCSVFQALCILDAIYKKPDCFDSAIFSLSLDQVLGEND